MIISASYKTDIPTFYGEWLMHRLRAGYCKTVNPYNGRSERVSLEPEDVDGLVLWTKNVGPFLPQLPEVWARGYRFILQYTINGYPRALEHAVVDANRSVEHLRRVADDYGPRVCIWRYDTIVASSLTDWDFHRRNFDALARQLAGFTDEVVISFAQLYRKTSRNLDAAARENGFTWWDPPVEDKVSLLAELRNIAAAHSIGLTVCSQPELCVEGAQPARCVDAIRLADITGRSLQVRVHGNRPGCGCYASRDIGAYDTCPHGCVYCYAVRNQRLAAARFRRHDPNGEFLFPPDKPDDADRILRLPQLKLFGDQG